MDLLSLVYGEYDYLVPSGFGGGYLILSLYEKIQRKELSEPFTTRDIKKSWEEISQKYHQSEPYGLENIIHKLGRYLIRDEVAQYGSYYLTRHAVELAEMLVDRMSNPYKEYPLKQTIDDYFFIRKNGINNFSDLDTKFGKRFVGPRLRVISGHLDALQDELNGAHAELGNIIQSDSLSATEMVQKFVRVFRQFGERAEDIRLSVATKDRFLESLKDEVNKFYDRIENGKQPESEEEKKELEQLTVDWKKAVEILTSLTEFFGEVDAIIERIRRQILYASNRLSELQYNLDTKSEFLLRIKRMLKLTLENAHCEHGEMRLNEAFPRKALPIERTRFFTPGYHDFVLPVRNKVIDQVVGQDYYQLQANHVKQTVEHEHRIQHWVGVFKAMLQEEGWVDFGDAFREILKQDASVELAINVGYELLQHARLEDNISINVSNELSAIPGHNLYLWNTKIKRLAASTS